MQKYSSERDKLRSLLTESIRLGVSLDAKFNEGNTLLHFAVALDMYDETVYLLESGANYLIINKEGMSPRDIALESGNQLMINLFRRESWYRKYIYDVNPLYNPDNDSKERNVAVLRDIFQPCIGYSDLNYSSWYSSELVQTSENQLDWTDAQICTRIEDLLELIRLQEQKLVANIKSLTDEKNIAMSEVSSMHNRLRNREHKICQKLFSVQELVRLYREKVNAYAEEKMMYKQEIQTVRRKIFFKGVCQQRVHNGFLVKLWKLCSLTLTGQYLLIADLSTNINTLGHRNLIECVDELLRSTDGDLSEPDLLNSQGHCTPGSHRIPIEDIHFVETTVSGARSSNPTVSFAIIIKQKSGSSLKDCKHLETIRSTRSVLSDGSDTTHVKLKQLIISLPALPMQQVSPSQTKQKDSTVVKIPDATEFVFPVDPSGVKLSYFDDISSKKHRYAHTFLLALRATSNEIKFGGNYLPFGWRYKKGSSSLTPKSGNSTPVSPSPSSSVKKTKKWKLESIFDRLFCSSTPDTTEKSVQASHSPVTPDSNSGKKGSDTVGSDDLPVGDNSDTDSYYLNTTRNGTATSRESACTSTQSNSQLSSASSSSCPRTSIESSARYSASGHEVGTFSYAPTHLETVAEREERQFSSDSDGQFSCKLAAHLAGIVTESVADPVVTNYGIKRRRSSSSNAEVLSVGSNGSAALSCKADSTTSPLGWEPIREIPMSAEKDSHDNACEDFSQRRVHYEEWVDSKKDNESIAVRDEEFSSSLQDHTVLSASVNLNYNVEELSWPSMSRSKSLPFKLPSSDCLASDSVTSFPLQQSEDGVVARSLADIDAEEFKRVTQVTEPLLEDINAMTDWKSIHSGEHSKSGDLHIVDLTTQQVVYPKGQNRSITDNAVFLAPLDDPPVARRTPDAVGTSSVCIASELSQRHRTGSEFEEPCQHQLSGESDKTSDTFRFRFDSVEDSISLRGKTGTPNSPTALLVRATPESPVRSTVRNPHGSPLLRTHRKSLPKELCPVDNNAEGKKNTSQQYSSPSEDIDPVDNEGRLSMPGTDHASIITDPDADADADDTELDMLAPHESFSHNSAYGSTVNTLDCSFRSTADSALYETNIDSDILGLVSDPNEPHFPTSRMTFSGNRVSPSSNFAAANISRQQPGISMLPSGGIDSPDVFYISSKDTTPINRTERASFSYGSANKSISSKNDTLTSLKKDSTSSRSNKKIVKSMRFRTLKDMQKSLKHVREVSAIGEERLTIALNDREVEHQKLTYLLALRGIVDHLPLVEDRIQFLNGSGDGKISASENGLGGIGHNCCDSPGGTSVTNMNSSHSATAIYAAATASLAAATSSCNNTMISEEERDSFSFERRRSFDCIDTPFDAPFSGDNDGRPNQCRVLSRDFMAESYGSRKAAYSLPSPLLLSSAKSYPGGTVGGDNYQGRVDSVSSSRLSSVDREVSRIAMHGSRNTTMSVGVSTVPGSGDSTIGTNSPKMGRQAFKYSSDDSRSSSALSIQLANKTLDKGFLSEYFGDSGSGLNETHMIPPVSALLCVPMGQPPHDVLEEYNTVFEHLRTIYSLDKAIFDSLQRLREIYYLKEELRNKYRNLQQQANIVTAPSAGDLYDVDL